MTFTSTPSIPELVDVELSNVVIGDAFSTGTLVSLTIEVPNEYDFFGSVYVFTTPDTFNQGFQEIPTTAGDVFELIILPEPAALLALLLLATRRHR